MNSTGFCRGVSSRACVRRRGARGPMHDHGRPGDGIDRPGRRIRAGRREVGRDGVPGSQRCGRRARLQARRRYPQLAEPGRRRGRRRQSACAIEEGSGHHRRHHLFGVDSDPDVGHRPGEDRSGLAGVVLADADHARPRGQDERHVLPHHHLRRAARHGGGQIRARPGLQENRRHPCQQRLRHEHVRRVRQGLQGARRRDRLRDAVQREAVEL